ncbi:MAG: molybdenum transporter substrate-binding protein [Chloroflexi bacterium]|nr:molybdenum transporter substrate-binding protein [Chloroflexota bacterium]
MVAWWPASIAFALVLSSACNAPRMTAPTSPVQPRTLSGEIIVFAASSLTNAFGEIGERFRLANPAVVMTFNFASSSQLVTQIDQGATADIFASADQAQMDRARVAGRIAGPDRVFATNRLVVITPVGNPGDVRGPADLAKAGLRVVTSQPDVPVGAYLQAMLDTIDRSQQFGTGFKNRVNANVVSQEANVRQIVGKVQLGEADAAIVYKTDVTPLVAPRVRSFEVPDEFNTVVSYPVAPVTKGPNPSVADAFSAFLLSPAGQSVLAKWSFSPVGSAGATCNLTLPAT